MNSITIIGRLTTDPVHAVRDVAGVTMNVANFTVAVNSRNSAGQERTDFFKVGVWRGAADACAAYLKKGSRVAVRGSVGLAQRTYNGRVYTDLTVHNAQVEFLDSAPATIQQTGEPEQPVEETEDEELPFDV